MKANELERIVSSLDKIPTLPVIYSKLGKLLQSPDATIQAVSNIISEDQVIAAKVLKFVNSAFYGFPQRIGSLQRAIVILGFNTIKNLVFATSVFDMFRGVETMALRQEKLLEALHRLRRGLESARRGGGSAQPRRGFHRGAAA